MPTVRRDFPILSRRVHGHRLVYLDNAATTQKPLVVLERLHHFYRQTNANIHRGIHRLAEEATALYEATRERVARFIGAADPRGVVFTSGTTGGAQPPGLRPGAHWLHPGDEILLTEMEHHSNLVPWFLAAKERGAGSGTSRSRTTDASTSTRLGELITERTRIVSVTHVSNVLGTINPIGEIADAAHAVGALVSVDARAERAPPRRRRAGARLRRPVVLRAQDARSDRASVCSGCGPTCSSGWSRTRAAAR